MDDTKRAWASMRPTWMAMDGMDVYITHLDFELNRLYHNNQDGTFTDDTFSSRIGNKAVLLSGVATKFLDYDNDGWNDILQLNGAMLDNVRCTTARSLTKNLF